MKKTSYLFYVILSIWNLSSMAMSPSGPSAAIPPEVVNAHLQTYNSEERQKTSYDLDVIRTLSFRSKTPSKQPIYLATVGGPGSMKSTILESFLQEHPQREAFVYIDPDMRGLKFMVHTYIQDMGPYAISVAPKDYGRHAYEKWRGASNYIATILFNEAFSQNLSIAHGTTGTAPVIGKLYKTLKEAGYKIVLLLCDTTSDNRRRSIKHREESQGFYQVTPDDAVQKSAVFYDRFPDYFLHADEIHFYWTDDFSKGSEKVAILKKGIGFVFVSKMFKKLKDRYEEARKAKPELPSFNDLVTAADPSFPIQNYFSE